MDLSFTVAGFIVGTLVGATGVGGGSLMTPILVLIFGVPASAAVGTDLLFAAVTKGFGTALHGLNQSVSWRVVGRLASGSIPAALGTLWLMNQLFDPTSLAAVITTTLGVALVLTSLSILFQPLLRRVFRKGISPSERPRLPDPEDEARLVLREEIACESRPQSTWLTVATGAILGALVSLTSVGAGAIGVMVLMSLYPKVRSVRIVGTDIAHAVPLTLVAGLGHAHAGSVEYGLLGALLLGSIPGIALGSQLAFKLPERILKHSLAVILIGVGGKLLLS
jgi:uncharacterized membrane protein YfcA